MWRAQVCRRPSTACGAGRARGSFKARSRPGRGSRRGRRARYRPRSHRPSAPAKDLVQLPLRPFCSFGLRREGRRHHLVPGLPASSLACSLAPKCPRLSSRQHAARTPVRRQHHGDGVGGEAGGARPAKAPWRRRSSNNLAGAEPGAVGHFILRIELAKHGRGCRAAAGQSGRAGPAHAGRR